MSNVSQESLTGNKETITRTLEALNLPLTEYFVIGGANLVLRGIKKATSDIDMLVSKKAFGALKNMDDSDVREAPRQARLRGATNSTVWVRNNQHLMSISATTEMGDGYFPMSFEGQRTDVEMIEGFPCLGLNGVIAAKAALRRTKDLEDLRAIEQFTGKAIDLSGPTLRPYEPDYDVGGLSLATALSLQRMDLLDS